MLSDEHAISNTPVPRPAVGRGLSNTEVSKSSSGGFQVTFRVDLWDEKDKMKLCGSKNGYCVCITLRLAYSLRQLDRISSVSVSSRFLDRTFQSCEEVWMD